MNRVKLAVSKDLSNLPREEQIQLLLSSGILIEVQVASVSFKKEQSFKERLKALFFKEDTSLQNGPKYAEHRIQIPLSGAKQIRLSEPYLTDFYHYLLGRFEVPISLELISFQQNLKKDFLGIDSKKKRKEILASYFSEYYNIVNNENPLQLSPNSNSTEMELEGYFDSLNSSRDHLKRVLASEVDLFMNYVLDNDDFFNNELINTSVFLSSIIQFEQYLKVLTYINKRGNFEANDYFTLVPRLDDQYKRLRTTLFNGPKGIEFIERFIKSEPNLSQEKIICLYEVLLKKGVINNKKTEFLNYLKGNYQLSFELNVIKNSERAGSLTNKNRIEKYSKLFEEKFLY